MKYRSDFVANSSSSSFVIAMKNEISEKQKLAIADEILGMVLGDKVEEESEMDEIRESLYRATSERAFNKAVEDGKTIRRGYVSFEYDVNDFANLCQKIWDMLEKSSDGDFVQIDTSLDY